MEVPVGTGANSAGALFSFDSANSTSNLRGAVVLILSETGPVNTYLRTILFLY